ncbi:hypothetical protein KSP40_PGU019367 [Platanthera guangdongensis]|uniref:Uncharacterized protein n=1 Tax=Platanthera guangdongensis TaxID=2320717 RepID=A0ABR2MX92_9ASPA
MPSLVFYNGGRVMVECLSVLCAEVCTGGHSQGAGSGERSGVRRAVLKSTAHGCGLESGALDMFMSSCHTYAPTVRSSMGFAVGLDSEEEEDAKSKQHSLTAK